MISWIGHKRSSIFLIIFFYFLSIQSALSNIYVDKHNQNICKSDESNSDLDCLSHCALMQMDNLNFENDLFVLFGKSFSDVYKSQIETKKHVIFDPKSNSPPL